MQTNYLLLILIGLLVMGVLVARPADKIVFLDVGQGDAILLQNGMKQVLIDGGQGTAVLSRLAEEMPWFDRRLDIVIVTHPQQDHLEGLLHVMERYQVGLVILPRLAADSLLQETWLNKITASGVAYRFAWQGQKLQVGEMALDILGPLDTPQAKTLAKANLNNGSVVTRLDYYDLSVLLTSDIERPAEMMLLSSAQSEQLDVDVLKVGHHGSKTSTASEFLQATSPLGAVISVGAKNRYGHPHPTVLSRLGNLPVWRTDQAGSIRFIFQAGQWYVTCSSAQLFFSAKSCIKADS